MKTDSKSRRVTQDDYLERAKEVGLDELLRGLVKIFQATNSKRKYYHLFVLLENIGLVTVPPQIHEIAGSESLAGISKHIPSISIQPPESEGEIVYVQPLGDGGGIISFAEFSKYISGYDDEFTRRFRESLSIWSTQKAGY